jgi:hypothetical protein
LTGGLVPAPFLFRFTLPVARVDRLPRAEAPLLELPESCRVPFPSALDQDPAWSELRIAWNPHGLGLSLTVAGKQDWPRCNPEAVLQSDGVQLWIDTRDTQSVHRATRYCHRFCLLPGGTGDDGRDPFLKQFPIPRAREDAPIVDPADLLLESDLHRDRYRVSVWFPAEALTGFDPESQTRLGFNLIVNDGDLGRAFFTVGDEFPVESDPSLWASLSLE